MDVEVIFDLKISKASDPLCSAFVDPKGRVFGVEFGYQLCVLCKRILLRTSEYVYWGPDLAVTSCLVSDVTDFVVQSAEKKWL